MLDLIIRPRVGRDLVTSLPKHRYFLPEDRVFTAGLLIKGMCYQNFHAATSNLNCAFFGIIDKQDWQQRLRKADVLLARGKRVLRYRSEATRSIQIIPGRAG